MRLGTVVAALFIAINALADAVVYPTGNATLDVTNVREAVRGGGTVLLKANDQTWKLELDNRWELIDAGMSATTAIGTIAARSRLILSRQIHGAATISTRTGR